MPVWGKRTWRHPVGGCRHLHRSPLFAGRRRAARAEADSNAAQARL